MKVKTAQLDEQIKHTSKTSLRDVLNDIPNITFISMIEDILKHTQKKKSVIIEESCLDRSYAYEILRGDKIPSKDKLLSLCLAMSCDLTTTNQLLKLSNNAPLYSKIQRDAVIMFAINNSYSVIQTNDLLNEHGFEILM